MEAMNLKEENFEQEVIQSQQTVIVDFWAEWCGPCKMFAPIIDEIAKEHTEIKVCKVNVDEQSSLAVRYKVMNIPTLLVFKDGEVVQKAVGVQSKEDIEKLIQE